MKEDKLNEHELRELGFLDKVEEKEATDNGSFWSESEQSGKV